MNIFEKNVGHDNENVSNLDMFSLKMFESRVFITAKYVGLMNVPDILKEFLEQFNTLVFIRSFSN